MHKTRGGEERLDWENRLEPPWRRPDREVAVYGALLADLVDGKPAGARTLSRLAAGRHYARACLVDPAPPEPTDPLDLVIRRAERRERRSLRTRVGELLGSLDSRESAVLRLRFGLDGAEPLGPGAIARELGVSRKTAYSTQRRALARLLGEARAHELREVCDELAA